MKTENSNLLTLSYNLNKGLILNWNFKGQIPNQMYFKHILILDHKNTDFLQQFVKEYYKRMKLGDLICLVKLQNSQNSNLLRWKQKSVGTQLKLKKVQSSFSNQQDLNSKLNQVAQQLQEYSQNVILNIFTDKKDITKSCQQVLSIRKSSNALDFVVTFFGDFQNEISYTSGINKLNYSALNYEKVLNFYHSKYISKIYFAYVKLTITCDNGCINCQKSDDWQNPEFNSLTKMFYAPHSDYLYDSLFVISQDGIDNTAYMLKLCLEYETFGKKKFKSEKNISINLQNQKIYLRTFGQREQNYQTQIQKGIWIKKNVYSTNCFVWFKKQEGLKLRQFD